MNKFLTNIPLAPRTTLRVGGDAQVLVDVASEAALDDAVGYAQEHALPLTVLGGGSNVLVSDGGVEGLVVAIGIKGISAEVNGGEVLLTAAAGEVLDDVVAYTVEHGYWGLENLSHIPGSVGAVPVQNVGAYGVEVKDLIDTVRVYNTLDRKYEVLSNEECSFGYRDSLFKKEVGKHYIVSAVTFRLTTKSRPRLEYKDLRNKFADTVPTQQEIRQAVIDIRSMKFPDWQRVGTAGSFFKNPIVSKEKFEELSAQYPELPGFPSNEDAVKIPLGWILDKILQLKGGGTPHVGQYEGQALVLINKGEATAQEIVAHAEDVIKKVLDATGIEVEYEVTKIGF